MYHQWRIKLAFTHSQKYSRILDWPSFGLRWYRPNLLAIHLSALIKLKAISRVFAEPLYSGNVCKNPRVRDLLSEWPHDNTTMQSIPTHRGKCIKVFRCFCLILKVWIIASICYSEQAALHDAGSRSSFIVTNLWQPKILFILLQFASHAEYNTMRCCPGLKGEITNSNWHLKWFPDEREERTIKTYFDASCQLGSDTDTRMTKWKQGSDAGKPG